MTRKDYILLANALNVELSRSRQFAQAADNRIAGYTQFEQGVLSSISVVADALETDNPRFDREHFVAVCRGEKPLMSRPARA